MIFRRDPLANPEPLIPRVYAYVAYRIGDGPDAQDVTSEVFERALRYRGSYDRRRGDPGSWLIGIARRCVHDFQLRRTEPPADTPETEDPTDLEGATVRKLMLARAVARLSGQERELLALRFGADLSARQIGELLEMQTNTVEVALGRALARLRIVLGESPDAEADVALPSVGEKSR
jgi:RNA polymerase sigma-70 factor, ECF subfamily